MPFTLIPSDTISLIPRPLLSVVLPMNPFHLPHSTKRGLPDDLGTFAMLSAIFMPACFMGNALGPMLGGFLVENHGYRNATAVVFSIILFMVRRIAIIAIANSDHVISF